MPRKPASRSNPKTEKGARLDASAPPAKPGKRAKPKRKAHVESPPARQSAPTVAIRLYDFQNLPFLPADAIADPAHDPLHGAAFALIREVLQFWENEFGRRSYDGAGRRVVMFLRYPSGGGYYEPELEALRFSGPWPFEGAEGRRYYFGDFSQSPDYVAHEFAHAVTNYCARLDYREAEQAALHESLSDCFAIAFRSARARHADPAAPVDWRFGVGVALPPLSCTRNLADPGDPRAWSRGFSHMGDVRPDAQGRVDPYALSTIASLAFRRVAEAMGEDVMQAARLWHGALDDPRMVDVKSFGAFADLTTLVARRAGAEPERIVRSAWASVGVGTSVPIEA